MLTFHCESEVVIDKYGTTWQTLGINHFFFYTSSYQFHPWPSSFPHFYVVICLEAIFTLDIYLLFQVTPVSLSFLSCPSFSCSHFSLCFPQIVLSPSATASLMWADMWNMANWRVCCYLIPSDKEINFISSPLFLYIHQHRNIPVASGTQKSE